MNKIQDCASCSRLLVFIVTTSDFFFIVGINKELTWDQGTQSSIVNGIHTIQLLKSINLEIKVV